MKNLLTALMLFSYLIGFSQDQIIKKDGSELNVKITEISDTELKYQKEGLSIVFTLSLNDVLLVTFSNGERMTFQDIKPKAEEPSTILLTAGTRIPVVMTETISSDKKGGRKVQVGELISLKVQADVTDIDGNVLVKQGTLVNGTITEASGRKAAGTKGKLSFNVEFVKAVDGQSLPVSLRYSFAGQDKSAVAIGAAAVVAAPLLLIKGKPAILYEGQVFNALVIGDKKIKIKQ